MPDIEMRNYFDAQGKYLRSVSSDSPESALPADRAGYTLLEPSHGLDTWDGEAWVPYQMPNVDGFYDSVFNDPLWTIHPELRPVRPELASTQAAVAKNLSVPSALRLSWEDTKIGMVAKLGQAGADLIIAMVEQKAAQYHVPII